MKLSEFGGQNLRLDWLVDPECRFYQNPDHFCANTDTALLALFARVRPGQTVLEIGCNNGALLCYLDRYAPGLLFGVEILPEPASLAALNLDAFAKSPWRIEEQDVRKWTDSAGQFDVIVCNPPFFTLEESREADLEDLRQCGRVEKNLKPSELFACVRRLLKDNGRFFLVHRPERIAEIFAGLQENGMEVVRLQSALDERDGKARALLIEAGLKKEGNRRVVHEAPFWITRKKILTSREKLAACADALKQG